MENFAHDFRELNLASETLPWTNIKNLVIKLVLEGKVCVYLCVFFLEICQGISRQYVT